MLAHGSGIDDLLIPLITVGAVAYFAFRPRVGRGDRPGRGAAATGCDYCGAPIRPGGPRCTRCGFRLPRTRAPAEPG